MNWEIIEVLFRFAPYVTAFMSTFEFGFWKVESKIVAELEPDIEAPFLSNTNTWSPSTNFDNVIFSFKMLSVESSSSI